MASPAPPIFTCPVCSVTFNRREHLKRHSRAHTQEKPFACTICSKRFARSDILSRHSASHANHALPRAVSAGPGSRACLGCAATRVRCSRGSPCQRCYERNQECVYPNGQVSNSVPTPGGLSASTLPGPGTGMPDLGSGHTPAYTAPPMPVLRSTNWLSPSFLVGDDWATAANSVLDMSLLVGDIGPMDNTPILQQPMDPIQAAGTLETAALPQEDLNDQAVWESMDWRGAGGVSESEQAAEQQPNSSRANAVTSAASVSSSVPSMEQCFSYVNGHGTRAPFSGRRFSQAEHTMPTSSGSPETDLVPAGTYQALLTGLQALAQEAGEDGLAVMSSGFPNLEQVRVYAVAYFGRFHRVFPFLRRSSFAADSAQDGVLLLAAAAIGTKYNDESDAVPSATRKMHRQILFHWLDSVLCRRRRAAENDSPARLTGRWMPHAQDYAERCAMDLPTLQASILWLVCVAHNGRADGVQQALRERHRLVDACRSMGLLSDLPGRMAANNAYQEYRRRTGLMIWFLDAFLAYSFECDTLLRLDDARTLLPCHEDAWDSSVAELPATNASRRLTVPQALDMLYIEKQLPPGLGEFSALLLIYAVCRHTKESVTHCHGSRLSAWIPHGGDPSQHASIQMSQAQTASALASAWRNSACDSLDVLHWRANSRAASTGGWEHPTILHLHLARLLLLVPTGAILAAAATPSRDGATTTTTAAAAAAAATHIQAVRNWTRREPFRARLSLIHAGALLWHVRRFSSSAFVEPFAVYLAVLVVWAYGREAGSDTQGSRRSQRNGSSLSIQGDDPQSAGREPTGSPGTAGSLEDCTWEEKPDTEFLYLDRPLDDELVQTFVRLGDSMTACISHVGDIRAPGAPGKMLREGIRLLMGKGADMAAIRPSGGVDEDATGECGTWGIELSYAIVLYRLAEREGGT